jgi:hypothetical protein
MKTNDRLLISLFILGVAVNFTTAILERVPGYMDAEYYYAGGMQLARGNGFNEQFIWNYLDNPQGLPHPSHLYWMPLPSIIAAGGMILAGNLDFLSARIFLIFIAGLIPVLTAKLAFKSGQDWRGAGLAGVLAILSGFYMIYTADTETFALYMVLASLFILVAYSPSESLKAAVIKYAGLGLLAGLMHLTRADGVLWLAVAGILCVNWWIKAGRKNSAHQFTPKISSGLISVILLGIAYLLPMAPWFARNIALSGSLFSPGGSLTLWLTNYDQTFSYPASLLNFGNWLSLGRGAHFKIWFDAILSNIKTLIAVQGEIFLLPLILLGLWRLKKLAWVQFALIMWLVTLGVMSIVFPFAGARGGFFHSGAAIQPVFWAVVPAGLESFVDFGTRFRNWNRQAAISFFSVSLIILSLIFSGYLFFQRVLISDGVNHVWDESYITSQKIEGVLLSLGCQPDDIVMVNNPPGYFVATGRKTIVIPNGELNTLLDVADRFKANYLILEKDHVTGLNDLYNYPADRPGLKYLTSIDNSVHIFQFIDNQ